MKWAFAIMYLLFWASASAQEVKINASNEDLKKMAELAEKRSEQAEARTREAMTEAEKRKKKEEKAKK